jgi:hypothetical protein
MSSYNEASLLTSVTLSGVNFAFLDYTATALLALRDCATSSWTTVTSAACVGTRGSGQTGQLGLVLLGLASTSKVLFSFDGQLHCGIFHSNCHFIFSDHFLSKLLS